MINFTVFMWSQLKWLQSYKNINWDLVIFSDETVFCDFSHSKRNRCRKLKYKAPKILKKSEGNAWTTISIIEIKSKSFTFITRILMRM